MCFFFFTQINYFQHLLSLSDAVMETPLHHLRVSDHDDDYMTERCIKHAKAMSSELLVLQSQCSQGTILFHNEIQAPSNLLFWSQFQERIQEILLFVCVCCVCVLCLCVCVVCLCVCVGVTVFSEGDTLVGYK